jgi:RimJ/RimL family protein N-acetyltransferase
MTRPADRTDTSDAPQAAAEVTVRPIRDGEDAQVRAVAGRAFDAFDRLLFSTRGRETLVAADGDDRIVGGVVLHAAPSRTLGPLGVVHFIFADPDRHLPGIGTRLRDAADARFDELGCTETSARIDVTNSASQALHRAGGYRPATVGPAGAPLGLAAAGALGAGRHRVRPRHAAVASPRPNGPSRAAHGPGARRDGCTQPAAAPGRRVASTPYRRRSPDRDGHPCRDRCRVLGSREAAIRLSARAGGLRLGHVPWTNGLGLAGALAATFGVWFPLTGSSTSQRPGWRHDSDAAMLGRAHLAGALVVAALAWTIVLTEPSTGWLAWGEIRRVAVLLALFDLVLGFPPLIGTAARHIRSWSARAYGVVALFGVGPLVVTLL